MGYPFSPLSCNQQTLDLAQNDLEGIKLSACNCIELKRLAQSLKQINELIPLLEEEEEDGGGKWSEKL